MTCGIINTEFGTAKINKTMGYYMVTSNNEGNNGKLLHRLVYERFWGIKLPSEIVVHHKDGNKLNNCILNLEAMTLEEHRSLHTEGANNPMYGKKGENNPQYKSYARIIKKGFNKGKQSYAIIKDGKNIKNSINPEKLVEWFEENYPNEELKIEV